MQPDTGLTDRRLIGQRIILACVLKSDRRYFCTDDECVSQCAGSTGDGSDDNRNDIKLKHIIKERTEVKSGGKMYQPAFSQAAFLYPSFPHPSPSLTADFSQCSDSKI